MFAVRDDDPESEDDGESEVDIDGLLGGRKDPHHKVSDNRANPVELVRSIRLGLEETHQYLEGLRTDATIVQQSLQSFVPSSTAFFGLSRTLLDTLDEAGNLLGGIGHPLCKAFRSRRLRV